MVNIDHYLCLDFGCASKAIVLGDSKSRDRSQKLLIDINKKTIGLR